MHARMQCNVMGPRVAIPCNQAVVVAAVVVVANGGEPTNISLVIAMRD